MDSKTTFKNVSVYVTSDGGKLDIGEITVDVSNVSIRDYVQAIKEVFRATKQIQEESFGVKDFEFPFVP